MCRKDHKKLVNVSLSELVESGGGSRVANCSSCESKFLVSYQGPSGMFCEVKRISWERGSA